MPAKSATRACASLCPSSGFPAQACRHGLQQDDVALIGVSIEELGSHSAGRIALGTRRGHAIRARERLDGAEAQMSDERGVLGACTGKVGNLFSRMRDWTNALEMHRAAAKLRYRFSPVS